MWRLVFLPMDTSFKVLLKLTYHFRQTKDLYYVKYSVVVLENVFTFVQICFLTNLIFLNVMIHSIHMAITPIFLTLTHRIPYFGVELKTH